MDKNVLRKINCTEMCIGVFVLVYVHVYACICDTHGSLSRGWVITDKPPHLETMCKFHASLIKRNGANNLKCGRYVYPEAQNSCILPIVDF